MSVQVNGPASGQPKTWGGFLQFNVAFAQRDLAHASIQLWLAHETPAGMAGISRVEMSEMVTPGQHVVDPCYLHLQGNAAQSLMDDLWAAGIRPSAKGVADTKHLQAHIDDLRRIVQHFLHL